MVREIKYPFMKDAPVEELNPAVAATVKKTVDQIPFRHSKFFPTDLHVHTSGAMKVVFTRLGLDNDKDKDAAMKRTKYWTAVVECINKRTVANRDLIKARWNEVRECKYNCQRICKWSKIL